MEYKLKTIRKRKQATADNKRERGMIRIKVRGRKRWVMPKKKDNANS